MHENDFQRLVLLCSYSSLRLLDVPHIYSLMPLTVDELEAEIKRSSSKVKHFLTTHWIEECSQIVRENRESVEAVVRNENEVIHVF